MVPESDKAQSISGCKSNLQIRELKFEDCEPISAAFSGIGWGKPVQQYLRYLDEQVAGKRRVLVAFAGEQFAGYLTIVWETDYPPFREAGIPEICDLNVLPQFRRLGIATRLMDIAESMISERSAIGGIGVGMTADYGAAQQMYVRRGYVPDGRGLYSHMQPIVYGDNIRVDDNLILFFEKRLAGLR